MRGRMPTLSDQDLLARLVAFPSVSARPSRPIADFVCEYLDRPGVAIDRYEYAGGDKVNVVARLGPRPDGERAGLVLSGHLDVVPADEPEWAGDPFVLRDTADGWSARGACDMKGFVALAMNAAAGLATETLARPLVLVFLSDEEIGSLGAQQLAAACPREHLPRSAVIGEPTSLAVVRMHKGHLRLRITVRGEGAHSGSPHLGCNAIERAGLVLAALRGLREELERERPAESEHFDAVPFTVLTVARIGGGEAINVIPDRCVIDVGVRLLPGAASAPMVDRITELATGAAGDGPGTDVETTNDSPPMLLAESARVHRALCALRGQAATHAVSFASDAGILQRDLGLECALFGPGTIEVAHRPNEFVPRAEMEAARTTVDALVRRCCIEDHA